MNIKTTIKLPPISFYEPKKMTKKVAMKKTIELLYRLYLQKDKVLYTESKVYYKEPK